MMAVFDFLFINPRRSIRRSNVWSVVNSVTPPLGLAMLASLLEQAGFRAEIVDANALGLDVSNILTRIPRGVRYVGLTATTPEIDTAVAVARAVRREHPETVVVLGGVHATVFHERLVAAGKVDMVVRGEGEEAAVALAKGLPLSSVPNLTWRSPAGDIVVNPKAERYADLNALPFPAYRKLPMPRYRSALGASKRSPSIGMITSRGCPGKCTFCNSSHLGHKTRMMSAERILEHILYLKRDFGIEEISFYDDTFTTNRRRVEEFCRLLISRDVDVAWSCFARVDTVRPDLLKLMRAAGCHQVGYGFESFDQDILCNINKRVTTTEIDTAVAWTRGAGIDVRGAFMLGSPGETRASMERTIAASKRLGIQFAIFNITTPYPGTDLFEEASRDGLLKHTDWTLYDLSHAVMELPTVSSGEVEALYTRAYREFYLRPRYALERLLALRTSHELRTHVAAAYGILTRLILGGRE